MWSKIIIVITFFFLVFYLPRHFIINVSPSEPLGIYKTQQKPVFEKGDIVAICLSSQYEKEGLTRGYLLPGFRCHKTAPLIKRIIAAPGDTVVLKETEIIVNHRIFPYVTKSVDNHGFRLKQISRGIYRNTQQYWLIGGNSADSWDSRYWGGVSLSQILYCVKREF